MSRRDFVAEMLGVIGETGAVDALALRRVETTIRQRFGGTHAVILRSPPPDRVAMREQVEQGLRSRKSVKEIAGELGVSRVTIYRLLKCRTKAKQ